MPPGLLRNRPLGLFADGDPSVTGIEVLVTLADELCAAAPTVLVVDDLQWADDASLASGISSSPNRPAPAAPDRDMPANSAPAGGPAGPRRRCASRRSGGHARTAGGDRRGRSGHGDGRSVARGQAAPADGSGGWQPALRARAGRSAPLCEDAVQIRRRGRVSPPSWDRLPVSLATILDDRLTSASAETAQLLRTAALLGGRFAVTDLAVVATPDGFGRGCEYAGGGGGRHGPDAGPELAFRHPLIRQALYENTVRRRCARRCTPRPRGNSRPPVRTRWPSGSSCPPEEDRVRDWARSWLIQAGHALATRAPQLAVELLAAAAETG